MTPRHLLVVDDDPLVHQSLKLVLPPHWRMISIETLAEIGQIAAVHGQTSFHAAFVDMHLSANEKGEGLRAIERITTFWPLAEVFGISGDQALDLMENALQSGARRFLSKPILSEEIHSTLQKVAALWSLREAGRWIGSSPASQYVLRRVADLQGESGTVLIEGETGCGKEVIAQLLNRQDSRSPRPFVPVNLGAIPESLFESEMFGHLRGAFTGADSSRTGLAEAANGGDLFLDEIEACPLPQQVKLLRFLESGEIRRVGAKEPLHLKVRIIAATNRSLLGLVKQGKFREDLYFRLCTHRITLPPLRDRSTDIEDLCLHFLATHPRGKRKVLATDALVKLRNHAWPGNVRELKRVCEQLPLSRLPIVRACDVDELLTVPAENPTAANNLELGLAPLLAQYECEILRKALRRSDGEVDKASQLLNISRSSLYKKMKDYDIEV